MSGAFANVKWLEAVYLSNLRASTKVVAAALALHAKTGENTCYPGLLRICRYTSLTKPTVIEHLEYLNVTGWITVRARWASKSVRTSNEYTLIEPAGGIAAELGNFKVANPGVVKLAHPPSLNDLEKVVNPVNPKNLSKKKENIDVKPLYPSLEGPEFNKIVDKIASSTKPKYW